MLELLSTLCVQVILAAQSTQLCSVLLYAARQLDGGKQCHTMEPATSSTLGTSIIVSYAQKPFFFKKLGGLVVSL